MHHRDRNPPSALRKVASFVFVVSSATACVTSPSAQPGAPRVSAGTSAIDAVCTRSPKRLARLDPRAPRNFSDAQRAFERGLALQRDERHADALAAFKEALKADPTYGLAHLEAGITHLYTDNAKAPMTEHLASAVVLLPQNPRAHLRFAQLQQEAGATDIAETHYKCALDLAPKFADAHEALTRLLLTEGRLDEAEHHARSAVALSPEATTYRVLLADILTRKQRWREAAVEVEQAARQVSRSAALFRRAADLYAKGGSDADAKRMRKFADVLDPPPKRRKLRPLRRRR